MRQVVVSAVVVWAMLVDCHSSLSTSECKRREGQQERETGWPVLVAVKPSQLVKTNVSVTLSLNHHPHTTLTLALPDTVSAASDVVLVKVQLQNEASNIDKTFEAPLLTNRWASMRLSRHSGNLRLELEAAGNQGVTYITRVHVPQAHHQNVDTVSYTCLQNHCIGDVDLQCLQGQEKKDHRDRQRASASVAESGWSLWPVLLMLVLLVLVGLLFGVWRYQHNLVKQRRRAAQLSSVSSSARGSRVRQRSNTGDSIVSQQEVQGGSGQTVQYSTILRGYDGPCTDEEESPPSPLRPGLSCLSPTPTNTKTLC